MSTNLGDETLIVLRTRLITAPGLPATRAWSNTIDVVPDPTLPFVEDAIVRFDSEPRECGPDAWQRTDVTYRVDVRVPKGSDAHAALAIGTAVKDVFRTGATLSVDGYEVELLDARLDTLPEGQWLRSRVTLDLQFDHP